MSAADFRKLADLFPNETVTHSYVQDIELPAVDGTAKAPASSPWSPWTTAWTTPSPPRSDPTPSWNSARSWKR